MLKLKKLFKIVSVLSLSLACASTLAFAGCSGNEDESGSVIKFEFLKAGIGTTVYEKLAEAYQESHPGVTIKLIPNTDINSSASAKVQSGNNVADLYSIRSLDQIKVWALKGLVEPLDDVYGSELSTGKTVKDSLTQNTAEICSYNQHYYSIPEYIGIEGFVYNQSLFEQYGWSVPTTTQELKELCERIVADTNGAVAPIVYCGASADGYLYSAVDNWVYEYEGIANMDYFYSYESAEVFNPEKSQGKVKALYKLKEFFFDNSDWVMAGSAGKKHIAAQRNLINGEAAMMLSGSWFETEMSAVLAEKPDVKMGMFKVPSISDENGNKLHAEGYTTEGDRDVYKAEFLSNYFIPSTAKNKEGAKDFLKWLTEPEACEIYTKYSNGVRPVEYELNPESTTYSSMSSFGKSVLTIAKENYLYTPNVTSPIAIQGLTGFWADGAYPFLKIQAGTLTPEKAVENNYTYAKNNWANWKANVGLS